jgi:hypothetical protein
VTRLISRHGDSEFSWPRFGVTLGGNMIYDEDLRRVCPDQSLLRLLLRQKARINLTNQC